MSSRIASGMFSRNSLAHAAHGTSLPAAVPIWSIVLAAFDESSGVTSGSM
jgi:hypothetical protein